MKIYIDKLPQGCYCCRYNRTINSERVCTLVYYRVGYMKHRAIECPLRPISDYKNEILKEVEKIIQEKISCFETISKEVPIVNNEECMIEDKHEVKPFKNKKNGRVIEKKISKAMNEYKCEHCNGTILKNEKYMYVKTIIDGKFTNIKLHQDCYNEVKWI